MMMINDGNMYEYGGDGCYDYDYNGYFYGSDLGLDNAYVDFDYQNLDSAVQDSITSTPATEATHAPDPEPTPEQPVAVVVIVGKRIPKDPAIEGLNLTRETRDLAYELKDRFPTVRFTSGRRNVSGQLRAMAGNVVKVRSFIKQVYKDSPLVRALQAWVDAHPEATTEAQIQAGLQSVANTFPIADVEALSKHTAGQAFDVQPVNGDLGNQITNFLRDKAINNGGKFFNREANQRRWHYQR
jgi:hypothetical protein